MGSEMCIRDSISYSLGQVRIADQRFVVLVNGEPRELRTKLPELGSHAPPKCRPAFVMINATDLTLIVREPFSFDQPKMPEPEPLHYAIGSPALVEQIEKENNLCPDVMLAAEQSRDVETLFQVFAMLKRSNAVDGVSFTIAQ